MNLKKEAWACDHLKTSNLSADNFKKIFDFDGSTPEPAIRSGDTGQRIPCFDSCQLITTLMCNICVHYQSSCVPNWLESVRINTGFPVVRTDGRAGGRCTVTWLPNFLGWVDLLTHGAPQARFARQSSANKRILCKQSKRKILRLYSIVHVAMETTKTSNFTYQSKSFISVFFTCQVSACELQPFSCRDLANDILYTYKLPKLCAVTLTAL